LKSYFDHWIVKAKVEDRTRITYASDLKAIVALFGNKELNDLSHKDLQTLMATSNSPTSGQSNSPRQDG
jgi:hypothetical protein